MMTTFLSLIKIMFALVIVCYSWSSSASTLSGSPFASNSSQLNGSSPQPPLAPKSASSSGLAWGPGSGCVDDECTCPVGYLQGEQVKECKEVNCKLFDPNTSMPPCWEWPNTYCAGDKCICYPGFHLAQKNTRCEDIPTESTSTTSSTTASTTPSTTSSTSLTTSSSGCKSKWSNCDNCQPNSVCAHVGYSCECVCQIGYNPRYEPGPNPPITTTYCDPYDCGKDYLDPCNTYWHNTYCKRDEHMCVCKQGYEPDPKITDSIPSCKWIPGWTSPTAVPATTSAPKMSTSTSSDASAKVGAFLWKICLWIIGIVVVIFLVAMCIAIVVCCFCCKSDKSKQARYNKNKSNAPMAPSKYPPMVGYPTPGSSDYGKGGPILVAVPGTSGLKASKVVGGSNVPNPPMALYPGPGGYPQANLVAVPGPIGSKDTKAVPSNGS